MGKHRNIKRLEAMKKRRREKGNRGSLDVSPQRTHSQPAKKGWLDVSSQRTNNELIQKVHTLCQLLRWRFAFRESVANLRRK